MRILRVFDVFGALEEEVNLSVIQFQGHTKPSTAELHEDYRLFATAPEEAPSRISAISINKSISSLIGNQFDVYFINWL